MTQITPVSNRPPPLVFLGSSGRPPQFLRLPPFFSLGQTRRSSDINHPHLTGLSLTWRLRHVATQDNTSEEAGERDREWKDGQAGQGLGCLPELPLDVWRVIWSKLPPSQLVRAAGVCREWRRECIGNRRDEAVALVTAPEALPDSELSRPQQALRAFHRILRRQNPFSGQPLPLSGMPFYVEGGFDAYGFEEEKGGDRFEWVHVAHPVISCYKASYSFCDTLEKAGVEADSIRHPPLELEVYWDCWSHSPVEAAIYLFPKSWEQRVWTQGLLLALTGGFQGLLRAGRLSDAPGSLALCRVLSIHCCCSEVMDGQCPTPPWLWPPPRATGVSQLGSLQSSVICPNTWWVDCTA